MVAGSPSLSPDATSPTTLSSLSRNASVISTSSSDEGPASLLPPPRPVRQFASPRSQSPQTIAGQRPRAPSYLSKELGYSSSESPHPPLSPVKPRSKSRGPNVSTADFKLGETLGDGSYSTVVRATYLPNGKEFAIKIVDKLFLVKKQKMPVALTERAALLRLATGHPGLVRLHFTFQDEYSLYFVIDLASNGEIQSQISKMGSFSVKCARYYIAQIIDAVDYMHKKGVIHRDLKPENLLLDDAYRLKIVDFGTAKMMDSEVKAENFVGTAQFIAPELILANETSKSSDLWAIGCVLFQMISGRFAFHGLSEFLIMQKVKQVDYTFPDGFDKAARDLVQKLLVKEPTERLGAGPPDSINSMNSLKGHEFFNGLDWTTLWTAPAPPLESGLVKKDPELSTSQNEQRWQEIGESWNRQLWQDDSDDEFPIASVPPTATTASRDIGPMGETRAVSSSLRSQAFPSREDSQPAPLISDDVKLSEGSRSSSSSGSSPSDEIATRIQEMSPFASFRSASPERRPPGEANLDRERGRNQVPTPIQGNGSPADVAASFKLSPDELVIFQSPVEMRAIRRHTSRLLPVAIPLPSKPKHRDLVLTSRRLLCVKRPGTPNSSIKLELLFESDQEKSKDPTSVISTVELKGEREFVILTGFKSHGFVCPDSSTASSWVQKIDNTLSLYKQSKPDRG